jgi:protein-disulfide isomerase
MLRRRSMWVAAGLAVAGLTLALLLVRQHAQAHAGVVSFCSINEFVNCDRVATSRFSVVLGIPVAAWGALAYGVALVLALAGLRAGRPHETWPAGLLFLLGALATAAAIALALVSELVIGALCLLCAGSWLVSASLLGSAWRATRPAGVAEAVRADLGVLRARKGLTFAAALAGVALLALVAAAYPRYWERARAVAQAQQPKPAAPPATGSGPPVVVVFSDYECPFCAIAHAETKKLLATRPDVTLVKRHFPLDPTCNPVVKRAMHPNACVLAAAAICAEEQGKLEPMDDALFANQQAHLPLETIVAQVGLDPARFKECLGAPSTVRRLQSDVQAGLAVGLKATPTYVVNGVAHSGQLTADLLPPPRAAAAPEPEPAPAARNP